MTFEYLVGGKPPNWMATNDPKWIDVTNDLTVAIYCVWSDPIYSHPTHNIHFEVNDESS